MSSGHLHGHYLQSGDSIEVSEVPRAHSPPDRKRGGRHQSVVGADFGPGRGKAGPQTCVHTCDKEIEWQGGEGCERALDERDSSCAVLLRRSVYPVQKLGGSDCCDRDLLVLAHLGCQTQ
jgi:hypothetical protein